MIPLFIITFGVGCAIVALAARHQRKRLERAADAHAYMEQQKRTPR